MSLSTEIRFLRLLGISLTGRKPQSGEDLPVSVAEWESFYRMAAEHAVQGLLYDSIEEIPSACRPNRDALLQLYASVIKIERANAHMDGVVAELFSAYTDIGASCYIVKGQAVARCYPKPNHRCPGDIDIYVRDHFEEVHLWAKENGTNIGDLDYKLGHHVHFCFRDVDVENHFLLLRMYHPAFNRLFRKYLEESLRKGTVSVERIGGNDVPVLPIELHLVYLVSHLVRHLFGLGVGLRQLLDILMFISFHGKKMDGKCLTETFQALKLTRVTDAIATIAVRDLGIDRDRISFSWSYCTDYADILLKLIFVSGNFGCKQVRGSVEKRQPSLLKFQMLCRNTFPLCRIYPREFLAALYMKGFHLLMRPVVRMSNTLNPTSVH